MMKALLKAFLYAIIGILLPLFTFNAGATTIVDTKHNLSVTGPGEIKSLSETRVCVFCHTPHNATPNTPLWNREVGSQNYSLYSSLTMKTAPLQPTGPSRLCLSCHDGTIALGAVLQPSGGISMINQISPGSPSSVGANLDLSGDHPFSFSYYDALSNPEINPVLSPDLIFYTEGNMNGFMECTTCHDPHEDRWLSPDKSAQLAGKFLRVEPKYSGLCLECHALTAWIGSKHQTSTALVDQSKFPVPPRQWPTWLTVAEWGCAICHTSHSSPSGQWLLNYASEAEVCDPCHGATPPIGDPHIAATILTQDFSSMPTIAAKGPAQNITAQTQKMSAHRVTVTSSLYSSNVSSLSLSGQSLFREVRCSSCHNTHAITDNPVSSQPDGRVTGSTTGVSGVDRYGVSIATSIYEYEICFKCHADTSGLFTLVARVVNTSNVRLQFDPINPSYHPVVERGQNPSIPSIPSVYEPALTVSAIIACTQCHNDDEGTKGPHGSSFAPILRERYETADNTVESYENYALCYRCHNRTSILNDDSFKRNVANNGGHSGHLASGASCSVCHDAHGVADDGGMTGSHTHLINFDTMVVSNFGYAYPTFNDLGTFSGSCNLTCHGKQHNDLAY